jgi:hypothetical protein
MYRLITALFTVALFFSSTTYTFAQEEVADFPLTMPSADGGDPSGPLNCFDYYTFGSVQADLQPGYTQTVPGSVLSFRGEVTNANPYPLLDGTLYVKIFRRSDTTFTAGDGNEVVDQFVIEDGITLPGNGKTSIDYDWQVPVNAEGGEYYAAYFFTTAKRYNLMGLSFTDDVVGNQAPFTITSDHTVAKLSKVDTRLNDQDHHFAAFPLHFEPGTEVVVTTTIENPSDTAKTLPLQWNQYAWDAMLEDNLRYTHTEVVTLAPNETKTVSYTVQPQRESIVYLTAITEDNQAKSILDIRYVRDNIEETRINFPGLSAFPLEKDKETMLFACAHSTNLPLVAGNTLTLTLTDREGNHIHQYQHIGDISGAMAGFGEAFTPERNINYATLTATLERNGVTVEAVTQVYDCTVIDPTSCLPETTDTSFFDTLKAHFLTIILTVVGLLLLAAIIVFYLKQRGEHIDGNTPTPTTTFLFLLFLLPSLFFLQPGVGEAKSATWSSPSSPQLAYCWNRPFNTPAPGTDVQPRACATIDTYNGGVNWEKALNGAVATVQYSAIITNRSTGAQISDGASVPAGTQIRLQTVPHAPADVSWFGTGFSQDSPNGEWRNNANPPGWATQQYGFIGEGVSANGPVCNAKDLLTTRDASAFYRVTGIYIPFVINPPAGKSATVSNLSCSGASVDGNGTFTQDCTVTAAGPVSVTFNFPATYGKYYYRYQDEGGITGDPFAGGLFIIDSGCYGNDNPLRQATAFESTAVKKNALAGSDYTVNVPAQTISFNFSATAVVPANNPPTTTITGPTSGAVNTPYTFSVRGTDPEGDTVRVGVDWNMDGTPDIGSPYGNFSPSGTTENFTQSWTTPGTYTIQANSQDSVSMGVSAWRTHTITIAAAPPVTADLTINGSNGPLNVAKNTTVNLNWTSANAGSCSKWGGTWGSGQTVGTSGSGSTVVANTTTYMVNCNGATDSVTVNVVNQGPNPPTISYVSGTREASQPLTFSIRGSDPDGDNVFYEIDWDNNGSVDATTMTVPSNTAQNGTHSWSTVGTVTFRARTVDVTGARSAWTSHSETLAAPPPPTVNLYVSVNGGGWSTGNPGPVDTNDTIRLSWNSTGASSCTGTNFNTGGATANSGLVVTTPAPGGSTSFTLSCTGAGGTDTKSITVQAGLPNFNRPIATHNLSTAFDPATGDYNYVTVSFQTANDGNSGTANTAPYSVQFDSRPLVTGTIPLLARGAHSPNFTHTFNTVPFGPHSATITVDTTNAVPESNEGDNSFTYSFTIPPPDPGLSITADRIQLRNNETTIIRWTTVATYPTLSCLVTGPGMNISPAPLTGNQTTHPITAKSEYLFKCTETTTGTTWSDSVMVETQGEIQET